MRNAYKKSRGLKGFLIILLTLVASAASAQGVSGVVTDGANGGPMPGVTVLVKGKSIGTVSDTEGKYSIKAGSEDVLVFSFIGYYKQEIAVGSQTSVDATMEVNIEQLGDVVVVGYGSVDKRDLTGAVDKVGTEDFNKGVMVSSKQLITGKIAGVQVLNDPSPRGGGSVRIRGGSTFDGNSDPLYVIDGIPMSKSAGHSEGGQDPLSFINPADIEDITVLKDASAAAIYGVQGASGVILITTKSGSGKLKFNYSGQYSVTANRRPPSMLSHSDFVVGIGLKGPRNLGKLGTANTDWVDEVTRLAQSQTHSFTASAGKKSYNFRASLSYVDNKGVLNTDRTQRITPSVKYTQKLLGDDLTFTLSYNGTYNWDRIAPNVMKDALTYAPTQSIYADSPTNGGYFEWDSPLSPTNPVSNINQSFNQARAWRNFVTIVGEYKLPFLEGLSVKGNLGYDHNSSRNQSLSLPTLKPDNNPEPGSLFYSQGVTETKTYEVYLNYKTELAGEHKLDLIAGHSYQDFRGEYPSLTKAEGVLYEDFGINDPLDFMDKDYYANNIELFRPDSNNINIYRLASLWGRVNYGYKGKYLVTATMRYDGSSRFSPTNDYKLFPSVAFAWRVMDEPFMDGLADIFSDLKLRTGYGLTGNQNISRQFGFVNLYVLGNGTAQYILGNDTIRTLRPSGANPALHWEETASLNFGLDFGLFKGRLNGSIDYYRKKTSDLLANVTWPIGALTTFNEFANIGAFEVNGIEVTLSSTILDKEGGLKWDASINASHYKEKITSLNFSNDPNGFGVPITGISGDVGQTVQVLRLGGRLNTFLVYEHLKQADGTPVPDREDVNGDGLANNLDMYKDQNGDGVINEQDLIAVPTATTRSHAWHDQ